MRKIMLLTCLFASSMLFGQSTLQLDNGTSCDLLVQLYEVDAACNQISATNYVVPAFTGVVANSPNGGEFVYAEITDWPATGCFAQALDTDGYRTCVKCPGFGAPTIATVSTGGCGQCPTSITMEWDAACPGGGTPNNHIHFY